MPIDLSIHCQEGLYQVRVFVLKDIEKYYNNIAIIKNEDGIDELAFQDIKLCENFLYMTSQIYGLVGLRTKIDYVCNLLQIL